MAKSPPPTYAPEGEAYYKHFSGQQHLQIRKEFHGKPNFEIKTCNKDFFFLNIKQLLSVAHFL